MCPEHLQEADAARGTRAQRGYGPEFDRARRTWARRFARGDEIDCWRCGWRIPPAGTWHLGHDGGVIIGPEHAHCNLEAAGKAGAETNAARRAAVPASADGRPARAGGPGAGVEGSERRTARRTPRVH